MAGTRLSWHDYAATWARLHGGFDPRLATPLVRGWLHLSYVLGSFLGRLRIPPTAITVVGTLLCLCVPVAAVRPPSGPFTAALLVLLAAVADSVDGAVAVATARTTRLGYLYDAVADRVGEATWLIAFWLVGAPGIIVAIGGALSWLHEYVRARAVSAGMREIGAVTVGERVHPLPRFRVEQRGPTGGNRLPTGPGSRGGAWGDPEYRRAYHRAWRAAHPEYREREVLRMARRRAREQGNDPAGIAVAPRFPRPLPRPVTACDCPCGCAETIVLNACGFCITGLHR